jgi:hypothetical protein
MQTKESAKNWNELEFLSWPEFKRMAPSVIRLEITRLGKLIDQFPPESEFRNILVKARFELTKFVDDLQKTARPPLTDFCISHLQAAILALSIGKNQLAEAPAAALDYILERLNYVYQRINLIY